MPVTIGTLTSNVNIVDSSSALSDEVIEQIIKRVIARLKEEMSTEEAGRKEREIRDRMSETEPF